MKRILLLAMCLLITASFVAFAAGGKEPAAAGGKKITIAFLFQDLETEFWVASHKAITETLRGKGIEVLERNANEDANRQLEQAKDAIAMKVDGVLMIPQDGDSAVTIAQVLNSAGIPVGVFGRPPSSKNAKTIVALPEEYPNASRMMTHLTKVAREKFVATKKKITPLCIVGDLGDPNAVNRRKAFMDIYNANRDIYNDVVEVPSKWDAATCLANLQSAMQANPQVDLVYVSSDFLYPQVRAVLEPMGKWKPIGDPNHVILGGVDGDLTAGRLMDQKIVDATASHDLYGMADAMMTKLVEAITKGVKTPEEWMSIDGFTLTQENMAQRRMDMWGNKLRTDIK
jgi:ABC-type sugar transport system substrate-binding protein